MIHFHRGQAFDRLVVRCDVLSQRFSMEPTITEESLSHHWPGVVEDEELLRVTVEEAGRKKGIHWRLEWCPPPSMLRFP